MVIAVAEIIEAAPDRPYYRRDQAKGVTPPELTKDCSFSEHIVRARGKRSRYTSLSTDQGSIVDFGPVLYQAHTLQVVTDGHDLIEHDALIAALRTEARNGEKADRSRAVLAQRYALRRREALISWTIDTRGVERKRLYEWSQARIAPYFRVVRHG